jgi:hypothetical protein
LGSQDVVFLATWPKINKLPSAEGILRTTGLNKLPALPQRSQYKSISDTQAEYKDITNYTKVTLLNKSTISIPA